MGALLGVVAGCTPPMPPAGTADPNPVGAPPGTDAGQVTVLQLNLCNSGIAACYTGRSVAEAAAVIHDEIPDLVTLNEICKGDLLTLRQALAGAIPDARVESAFQGARDRRTAGVYRCRNGEPYGIGLISRWPSVPGSAAVGGIYPSQDPDDPEMRAWLCLDAAAPPAITVCTTHLAYTKVEVAAAQCRYLFGKFTAKMRERDAARPVVFGGDLNLGPADSADTKVCLPAASAIVDDGGVQVVVAPPGSIVTNSQRIDLHGASDHPGLLVTLALARR